MVRRSSNQVPSSIVPFAPFAPFELPIGQRCGDVPRPAAPSYYYDTVYIELGRSVPFSSKQCYSSFRPFRDRRQTPRTLSFESRLACCRLRMMRQEKSAEVLMVSLPSVSTLPTKRRLHLMDGKFFRLCRWRYWRFFCRVSLTIMTHAYLLDDKWSLVCRGRRLPVSAMIRASTNRSLTEPSFREHMAKIQTYHRPSCSARIFPHSLRSFDKSSPMNPLSA